MAETVPAAASPLPEVGRLTVAELREALKAGIADFRRAPTYGAIFAAFYVVVGIALIVIGAGTLTWTLTLSLGFPLVAPFAAVGLYEISRRLERGDRLEAAAIFGVVAAERRRQIPWIGAILVMIFLFWSFFAHMLFAAFVGPSAMFEPVSVAWLLTAEGALHSAIQLVIGGLVAFFTFSITVVSLPLLLEKEIDFVSAMLLSLRTVTANLGVMLIWALIIAVLVIAAMIPAFLGLFIVLPVLGHATWHLYRRALYDPV